ncbi:MAG: serine/threonine-protein kinase [Thermoanaerobaculia bacterium]
MTYRFGLPLDRVILGEVVGQGVSGQVFCGQIKNGPPVAVKVYAMEGVDPAFRPRERFRRECRLLSRLRHPAFPTLFGCGELEDDTSYAIMEWIEGRPLSESRTAPVSDVLRLAHGIASGLAALHALGAIHRDVAFDNVLVEARRSGLNPRLIDLGVAKELEPDEELTAVGNFLGRLECASPEQLTERGAAGARDPRSDVFSLGVLLFEWLTAQKPFTGATPAEINKAHRRGGLPAFVVDPARGRIDPSVKDFVLRLLSPDLAGRPDSHQMVDGLLHLRRLHPPAPRASSSRDLLIDEEEGVFVVRTKVFPARPRAKALRDLTPSSIALELEKDIGRGAESEWLTAARIPIVQPDVPPPAPADAGLMSVLAASPRVSQWILWLGVVAFVLTSAAAVALFVRS